MSEMALTLARMADIRSSLSTIGVTPPGAGSTSGTAAGGTADFASLLLAAGATGSGTTGLAGDTGGAGGLDLSSLASLTGLGGASGTLSPLAGTTAAGPPDGDAAVADARRYLGVPYAWGGTDPDVGLDCSGLTQRVFGDLGVSLPRTVAQQQYSGQPVSSMAEARPGDLLVFGEHHIGIYVGDGKMLHAPHTGSSVRISDVYATPTKIRRVLPAGDGTVGGPTAAGGYARPAALRPGGSGTYDQLFEAATTRYGLPTGLLSAVARAESNYNPGARSGAGAIGLMQLMPGTARELGVDPADPAQAVDGAARLLRGHLDSFGTVPLALAAYNAGPGAVRRYDGIPPYSETRGYVSRVTSFMNGVPA